MGGRFPGWPLPPRPGSTCLPPLTWLGSTHPCYQVQPSSRAAALQSTTGCFPKSVVNPHQPAAQSLGGAAALTWARGDSQPQQVCTCLAQLCCRKLKGWATEQMRMGYRKGPLPALGTTLFIRPSAAGQKEMYPLLNLHCRVTIAEPSTYYTGGLCNDRLYACIVQGGCQRREAAHTSAV